jgi:hypothetical protein
MRLSLPTVIGLVAVVGAGAFAAGQSMAPASTSTSITSASPSPPAATLAMATAESDEPLPPGHPPTGAGPAMGAPGEALPPGHPPVDPLGFQGAPAPMASGAAAAPSALLEWKAPARWQSVPNASTMRIATFKVPRAAGDTEDAELSITQAGGSVDANAERWIGQFDAASQKSAKRSTRTVGGLAVAIVEAKGTLAGGGMGMGNEPSSTTGRALLGAIVSTPGMPYFFKLTGPAASVLAARAELDALLASLVMR